MPQTLPKVVSGGNVWCLTALFRPSFGPVKRFHGILKPADDQIKAVPAPGTFVAKFIYSYLAPHLAGESLPTYRT